MQISVTPPDASSTILAGIRPVVGQYNTHLEGPMNTERAGQVWLHGKGGVGVAALPEITPITLSGTVQIDKDSATEPVSGAAVRAVSLDNSKFHDAMTDQQGYFSLESLQPGIWKITVQADGYVAPPSLMANFPSFSAGLDFTLKRGAAVTGTVYQKKLQRRQREPVGGALVRASRKEERHITTADANGIYQLGPLAFGDWEFSAMREDGFPSKPTAKTIVDATPVKDVNLELELIYETRSQSIGWLFCSVLAIIFVAMLVAYGLNYWRIDPRLDNHFVAVKTLVEQLKQQAANILEGRDTADKLGASIDQIIAHIQEVRAGYGDSLGQIKNQLIAAARSHDKTAVQNRLTALEMQVQNAFDQDGNVWTDDGETFFNTLFWGLAGVLAYKLIIIGTYVRFRRFYVEGIVIHLSHIIVAPILVLVAVWLLSQVKFQLVLSEENRFIVDLNKPQILYAIAFILGSNPWGLWGFVQRYSDTLTRTSTAADSAEPSPANPVQPSGQ
jgi:Carboxypeptidase regulatory-like domain